MYVLYLCMYVRVLCMTLCTLHVSCPGQLGDGAAMYLGEVINPRGERWELQLKGRLAEDVWCCTRVCVSVSE